MCDHGDTVELLVPITADNRRTSRGPRWASKPIDSCIAPIVTALNTAGIRTKASCCGHGNRPGVITLHDGREIVIKTGQVQRYDM